MASPFVEELTDRGILFHEAKGLSTWMLALLSMVIFCLAHSETGGVAKALAVVPAAACS